MILTNLSPIISVGLLSIFVDLLLAVVILANDRKSITNIIFALFNIVTVCWISANLLGTYVPLLPDKLLWVRLVMFFALWQAYLFFVLASVFPQSRPAHFLKKFKYLTLLAIAVSAVTLTPYLFPGIAAVGPNGIPTPTVGLGMIVFAPVALLFVVLGVYRLIRKYQRAQGIERKQIQYLLTGAGIMFVLFLIFNFGLVVLFGITLPINFSSVFTSIFIIFTSYSIIRYGLFNIKTIATELFVFLLWVFILVRIFISNSLQDQIAEGVLLLITLIVGVLLIRSVFREVHQREEIQKLAEQLEDTNERQEGLIHFIGHEVKGYLTKAQGTFAAMDEGDLGKLPEAMKPFIARALRDTRDGVSSVTNILTASNLKKGTLAYGKEEFDLKAAACEAVEKARNTAETKGLKLTFTADQGDFTFVGDKGKIEEHVLRNLVDNSVNYTPAGSIDVTLKHGEGEYIFAVKDTGVGITEEDKKRLFTEGGHGKESQKVNVHSTGYGLFIAKQVTEGHGGTITASSEGAGKGSTFTVEFPISSGASL